ncbi:hypothetical protein ABZY09_47240 [Streptomyces sp. NPDC002928]
MNLTAAANHYRSRLEHTLDGRRTSGGKEVWAEWRAPYAEAK